MSQFSVNKKKLVGLILDLLWTFFKSELTQLDICGCKNNLFFRQSKCNILSLKSNQFDLKHQTLLIRRLLNIENWHIKIQGPRPPWGPKMTGSFKSYLQKYLVWNQFFLFKKTASCSFRLYMNFVKISNTYSRRQWITMRACETKAIQADLGIFTHSLGQSSIFQHVQA